MITPMEIIAPLMPSSWPRCTFLISPLNEHAATANQIEKAGQMKKFSVELTEPAGSAAALTTLA